MLNRKYKKDVLDYIRPFAKRHIKPVVTWIYQKPFYSIIILILFVYTLLFLDTVLKALAISFLILLGGISKMYQRYTTLPVGMELVMFSTVLAGYIYGSLIGGLVGFASFALATYFSVRYTAYVVPSFAIYVLAGVFAPFFGNITIAGIVFTLVFVIVLSYISIALLLSRAHRVFMFAITSLLWNFWIFFSIAPRIVNFLT